MASALSSQMSGQMAGWPAAIRVMSRNPPAASWSRAACSSPRPAARSIRVAAVRWGTWETTATRASCWDGVQGHHVGSQVGQDVADPGVGRRGRSPRWGSAPRWRPRTAHPRPRPGRPARSRPWGGPPTKNGWSTEATSGPFTPPTSVMTVLAGPRRRVQDVPDDLAGGVHRGGHHHQVGRVVDPLLGEGPHLHGPGGHARRRHPRRSPTSPGRAGPSPPIPR